MPAPGGSTWGDSASGGDVAVLTRAETDLGVRVLGLATFQSFAFGLLERSVSPGEGGDGNAG